MAQLSEGDKTFLTEKFLIHNDEFNKLKNPSQHRILEVLLAVHRYHELIEDLKSEGWTAQKIREGLKILRGCKRLIAKNIKIDNKILPYLDYVEEHIASEIDELNDLYQEAVSKPIEKTSKEPGLGEILTEGMGNLFDGVFWGLSWGIAITVFLLLAFMLLVPDHIYPMIGNCNRGENLVDCYFRIQFERKQLQEFTECQQACGMGLGHELCLEECEYKFGRNKWQYPSK